MILLLRKEFQTDLRLQATKAILMLNSQPTNGH